MNREEAIADMRAGYRVQVQDYHNNPIRWMDRDGQVWLNGTRSDLPNMLPLNYRRLPFTCEDACRWLSQTGWLSLGPFSTPTDRELQRRFRYDIYGNFVVMREGTDFWSALNGPWHIPDQYAPVHPNDPIRTGPHASIRTRFDIIEDF